MVAPGQETWLTRWMRRALILGAIALAVLSISFPADASTHAVRATTIARMLRFVEWTAAASPGGGLTVAVVDNTTLGAALRRAFLLLQPGGRVVTVLDVTSAQALHGRQPSVVVLGADSAMLAAPLSERGVLTVGDNDCPHADALMLKLVADGDRYRFSANPVVAARAGVNLSSRLLRLAEIVD
jgi:hypothetical protein